MGTPAAQGGLSLYADLLEGAESSNSKQQQQSAQDEQQQKTDSTQAAKSLASALRFQPIRRPQVKQPNKPKPTFPKAFIPASATAAAGTAATSSGSDGAATGAATTSATAQPAAAAAPAPVQRSTLADWTATEEDDYLYGAGQYQRGGRRKKKKKNNDVPEETNWDDLYDPARPTNIEEYLQSDERLREIQEWKDVLYAHRRNRRTETMSRSRSRSSSRGRARYRDRFRSTSRSRSSDRRSYDRRSYDSRSLSDRDDDRRPLGNFAPPASLSFAPPPVSPPSAPAIDAATGDDAYARRLALSGMGVPPPPPAANPGPPAPPPEFYQAPPPPPPPAPTGVISREAVTYAPPPTRDPDEMEMDIDDEDGELEDYNYVPPPIGSSTADNGDSQAEDQQQPRSNRPGQADFAARLMSKYGWTKGSGLGADESGITSALRVKIEKRRKRPDAEGGGFAEPGGRGKIIGGAPAKKKDGESSSGSGGGGKFGKMSVVIALDNMLSNMTEADLEADIESGDLKQDIGQECGDKYGRIERISIDPVARRVFIKFTDQVSALRAVNDLEGRNFNGNTIAARFFDLDEFEEGVYR
ncbi:hypothetical protein V8F20_002073 [Naviculisporaceae sp. PSN 640]